MAFTQEMQRVDQELHLELAESPINPAFIHMSPPIPNGCDPLFYLKINCEALWKWPELKMDPTQMFHALQNGLASIGYKLNLSSEVRVGNVLKRMVFHVIWRVTAETNGEKRKRFRNQYWTTISLHPEEIFQGPQGVIEELKRREEELTEECDKLRREVEGEDNKNSNKNNNNNNIIIIMSQFDRRLSHSIETNGQFDRSKGFDQNDLRTKQP